MVKAPICKLCHEPHWLNQPHAWEKRREESETAAPVSAPKAARLEAAQEAVPALKPAAALLVEAPALPKRDRAAYMREYRARHGDA